VDVMALADLVGVTATGMILAPLCAFGAAWWRTRGAGRRS